MEGQGVSQVGDDPRGVVEDARQHLMEVGEIIKNLVTNRPGLALGVALAAGVFVGWLIKRR
jgi:hypothetical protein